MKTALTAITIGLLIIYVGMLIYGRKRTDDYRFNALTQFLQAGIWVLIMINTWNDIPASVKILYVAIALISAGSGIWVLLRHR